ncbi:hypothetical protein [Rhodoblastus sp.]
MTPPRRWSTRDIAVKASMIATAGPFRSYDFAQTTTSAVKPFGVNFKW